MYIIKNNMFIIVTRLVRSLSEAQLKILPSTCYAPHYLPFNANDICNCVDCCKYKPPPNNFISTITIKKNEYVYLNN